MLGQRLSGGGSEAGRAEGDYLHGGSSPCSSQEFDDDGMEECTQQSFPATQEATQSSLGFEDEDENLTGGSAASQPLDVVEPPPPLPWGRLIRDGQPAIDLFPRELKEESDVMNEYTIGRSKNTGDDSHVDIPIRVADNKMNLKVSSVHCRIWCQAAPGGGPKTRMDVYIEDLSANGTWINYPDAKLSKHQRRILHSGDEILLVDPNKNNNKKCEECNFTFIDKQNRMGCEVVFEFRSGTLTL